MLFKTSKKKVQTLILQMDNKIIDEVLDFNFLGIHFNEQLNWKSHIDKLSVKGALYRIQILCRRYTFWSYPAGLTIADPPG